MKTNRPVTQREQDDADSLIIVSTTDTKGIITDCNRPFVAISGSLGSELIGASHNLVRHPDIPAAVFKELWTTLKSERPWRGIIENRRKNGDHDWVDADVTPVYEGTTLAGYPSVRTKPRRDQVAAAERL